jgi:hypothetical protein
VTALPRIEDGYGYVASERDLGFLRIAIMHAWDWQNRIRPFGMTIQQYEQFCDSLHRTLLREGLTDYDLRLQGSSAHFFSGHHKCMPWTRTEIVEEFRNLRGRMPDPSEVDEIDETLSKIWPDDSTRPRRRPFDSMFRIGISREPSDIDVQMSSDQAAQRVRSLVRKLGIPMHDSIITSVKFDFFRKDIVYAEFSLLETWALLQSDKLSRLVTIAAFPISGPPNKEAPIVELSSHFRTTDWKLP